MSWTPRQFERRERSWHTSERESRDASSCATRRWPRGQCLWGDLPPHWSRPGRRPRRSWAPSLIGKLEGPEIIRDPAKFPKTFKEAPMLAELVKAGKLPPVEQRLPEPTDLMVVKPLKEIGKYGGRWRRGFTGPADNENGNRIVSTDKILMWDYTGNKAAPSLVKDWRQSDDGKVTRDLPAQGAQVVGWTAVHRGRLPVLVRRTSIRTRISCRRRSRSFRSTANPGGCTSATITPWSSNSPSRTSSSWTSSPATP